MTTIEISDDVLQPSAFPLLPSFLILVVVSLAPFSVSLAPVSVSPGPIFVSPDMPSDVLAPCCWSIDQDKLLRTVLLVGEIKPFVRAGTEASWSGIIIMESEQSQNFKIYKNRR
jgi:hypothetical protein